MPYTASRTPIIQLVILVLRINAAKTGHIANYYFLLYFDVFCRGIFDLSNSAPHPAEPDPAQQGSDERRYARTLLGDAARSALSAIPPHWREAAAERWFRRDGAPGPANEHVFQYLLSMAASSDAPQQAHAAALKGADLFYERQYRQYLNPTMGAFAATAELALLACGGKRRGLLWGARRQLHTAAAEAAGGAGPVAVLDRQSAAIPLLLPQPSGREAASDIERWLSGNGRMPGSYRRLATGETLPSAITGASARRRSATGALIELADNIRHTGKLAILALHPHDPDAMGLHITLFGTQILSPEAMEASYGLERNFLDPWRKAAATQNALLYFFAGATEETFAHCSLNLFIKRPAPAAEAASCCTWSPAEPLDALLAKQFELFQATVSASGLPGISPRNCDIGKAGYPVRLGLKTGILVPYFTGNFIHGHAAKLWSNPEGALMIRDDHSTLSFVTVRGPARPASHRWVKKNFPRLAAETAKRRKQSGEPAADPDYWLVHQIAEILQQDEPLAANVLDPARPTGSIHAAGPALYSKKAEYFATNTLPRYDQGAQHAREAAGRPADPSGESHRRWQREMAPALAARLAHLERADTSRRAPLKLDSGAP
jgi:hypothetical protein